MVAQLTILETVYFQQPNEDAITVSPDPYSVELATEDQPYIRRYSVEDKVEVDWGWLDKPGMIVVKNTSMTTSVRIPELKIVVPPKCSSRFWLEEDTKISLVASEKTKVDVTIIPNG